MKNKKKITKLRLSNNPVDEVILTGLVSSEPDYKISLSINKKFGISLRNSIPLKVTDESGTEISFSRFSFSDASSGMVYNLVSNRSGSNFLLKKLKKIDYIFQVNDPEKEYGSDVLNNILRQTESVTAVFSIDLKSFRDKNLDHLIQ